MWAVEKIIVSGDADFPHPEEHVWRGDEGHIVYTNHHGLRNP